MITLYSPGFRVISVLWKMKPKLTLQLTALSVTNLATAFLLQWYVIVMLGPGAETDALFAAMTIPHLALSVISGSLVHVLVPLLSGENGPRVRHDAWAFLALVGGLFGILAVILYVSATWWVPLTVPGFDETSRSLTIDLTRIQLVGMVFAAVNGVQSAAYHARQEYLWAAFTPIIAGAMAFLLLIWAFPSFGVFAAAWIGVLRMTVQTLLLAPGMGRPLPPDFNSLPVRQAWHRIKPLLLGTSYYKTDPLVDRFLLSMVGTGTLSLYYLGQQIYGAANQVVNKAIASPTVPVLSMLHKARDKKGFRNLFYRKLLQVGVVSLAGLLVIGFAGQAMLSILVEHGNLTPKDVIQLWWIMIWLAGVFLGGAMGQICSSSFYASGDTVTLTRMSMVTYTTYIPAKVAAFYFWGVAGLAVGTSVYYLTNLFLQLVLLRRKSIC